MEKNKLRNKINEILEVPRELSKNNTKITIIGFDEMLIENYKGILEYEQFYIKIKTELGNISINGYNLNLEQATDDDILVKGDIKNLEIEKI